MYHNKLFAVLILSVALSLCSGASYYPTSLTTETGTVSATPVSALRTKDQSGTQDIWNNYIEFYGSTTAYKGIFSFDITGASTVSTYSLNFNFKGPAKATQVWQLEWFVPSTNTYAVVGTNSETGWTWTSSTFLGTVPFNTLVSNNIVKLRFSSLTKGDDCDVDFLELVLNSQANSTTAPTAAPTTTPTPKPTTAPTTTPTPKPTTAPTTTPKPTTAPTTTPKPTTAPTTTPKPTTAPTTTPKPTTAPTTTPTPKPTTAPTTTPKPTTAPTTTPKPTNPPSTGGRVCPAGKRYVPGPQTTWQWQLSGTVDTSINVQVYDIDMFGSSASLISTLHTQGRAVICYIDTAYEPGRPDSAQFTAAVLGNGIDGWPGQKWVDIRSAIVRNIMKSRLAQAAAKGCDAVEMDDVDAYLNNPGFPLTAADQLNFNTFLAVEAHKLDLGVALKNDLDQVPALAPIFDFAVNEQCYQYGECDGLSAFINLGKAVFGVEYEIQTTAFCSKANTAKFSWLKKNLDLDAPLTQCCPTCQGTYSCVSSTASRSVEEEEESVKEEMIEKEEEVNEKEDEVNEKEEAMIEKEGRDNEAKFDDNEAFYQNSASKTVGVTFVAFIALFAALF